MLTNDMLRNRVPAAFSDGHAMTERYVQVPTHRVITSMADAGYHPVQAQQDNPRRRDPRFVTHRVILRHEDNLSPDTGAGEVPQIILVNSHNGRTKLRMYAGLYRFVCANGLVVGREHFRMEVAHMTGAVAAALEFAERITRQATDLAAVIERWSAIELSKQRANEMARHAAELRFGDTAASYDVKDLLEARRTEDDGRSLWQVYNRLQENGAKGNVQGQSASGRRVRSRPLSAIHADMDFNTGLWNLAERYAEAA